MPDIAESFQSKKTGLDRFLTGVTLGFALIASEKLSFTMGIKVCISRWITGFSCVGSGG
jgi:hypothetical protein